MRIAFQEDRRKFLVTSAVGAAGVAIGCNPSSPEPSGTTEPDAWKNKQQVHPTIGNLRVVAVHDAKMVTGNPTGIDVMKRQNDPVNSAAVQANMDALAKALAGKSSSSEAWAAILALPSNKPAAQVRAAVKVNSLYADICPRLAIVDKVCKELIALGVAPNNIFIYDGVHEVESLYGSDYSKAKLPAGVRPVDSLGGKTTIAIPGTSERLPCLGWLAKDAGANAIDLLVNVAVNKGHDQIDKGGFTLTLKNHVGSIHFRCPTLDQMLGMNKSTAILGGTPPRQRLCIVDSLWGARNGPSQPATDSLSRIVMGTYSPVVDYLTNKKIRQALMSGARTNDAAVARFATDFGYTTAEYDAAEWVDVPPAA